MHPTWKSRLSVCEMCTFRWSFQEDVVRYKAAGFDAMGMWRPKISDCAQESVLPFLEEHGMKVASMHWIGGFTGSEGRSFRDAMMDGFDAIQLASIIGAETVVLLSGPRAGHTRNHLRKTLTHALRELTEAAMSKNVRIAIEPMHIGCASDFTFLNDVPDTLELISNVDSPNLGLVFDCYHLAQNDDVFDLLPDVVPYVQLVQIGDAKSAPFGEQNRCLLGEGRLPLASVIEVLEEEGYQGYYELELIGEDIEHVSYEDVLSQSLDVFARDLIPK